MINRISFHVNDLKQQRQQQPKKQTNKNKTKQNKKTNKQNKKTNTPHTHTPPPHTHKNHHHHRQQQQQQQIIHLFQNYRKINDLYVYIDKRIVLNQTGTRGYSPIKT